MNCPNLKTGGQSEPTGFASRPVNGPVVCPKPMDPEESEYAVQESWRKDWWAFARSALSHWWAWIGVAVGGTVISGWQIMGGSIPYWFGPLVISFGLTFAAFQAWRDERRKRVECERTTQKPKLAIACGEGIVPPTIARNKNLFNKQTGAVIATADLFGFSLTNSGPGIVIKCRAALTSVEKDGIILCSDPGALPFEPLNAGPDLEVVDLHPGLTQRASVCSIKDDGTVHAGSFGMLWRHSKFPEYFEAEGDYTLNVTVAAENIAEPTYLKFTLHRKKDRTKSSIELQ
jgi:hypothetical protein